MTGNDRAYRLLLALGALDAAGYSVIVPVTPGIADATGAGPATIGLLVASFPLGMVAGFWMAGRAVERHGIRPLLLSALLLIAAGTLGFGLTNALTRGFWVAASAVLFAYLVLGLMEGTLPLHLAERLTQAEIGALYVDLALVVAAGAAAAGSQRPRSMVFVSVLLAVAGISVAGVVALVPVWVLSLALAATAVGLGSTGSLGLLMEAVSVKRIVTAMVVWSQIGIAGYLVGPLAGGLVAEGLDYPALGLVPTVFGLAALVALYAHRRRRLPSDVRT